MSNPPKTLLPSSDHDSRVPTIAVRSISSSLVFQRSHAQVIQFWTMVYDYGSVKNGHDPCFCGLWHVATAATWSFTVYRIDDIEEAQTLSIYDPSLSYLV